MNLFRIEFIRVTWSPDLEGKEVIVSNNIDVMKENIEKGCMHYATITRSIGGGIGLHDTEGNDWNYAYDDPSLKSTEGLKWTDLKLGDKIRTKNRDKEGIVTRIDKSDPNALHIFAGSWIPDEHFSERWELAND